MSIDESTTPEAKHNDNPTACGIDKEPVIISKPKAPHANKDTPTR